MSVLHNNLSPSWFSALEYSSPVKKNNWRPKDHTQKLKLCKLLTQTLRWTWSEPDKLFHVLPEGWVSKAQRFFWGETNWWIISTSISCTALGWGVFKGAAHVKNRHYCMPPTWFHPLGAIKTISKTFDCQLAHVFSALQVTATSEHTPLIPSHFYGFVAS